MAFSPAENAMLDPSLIEAYRATDYVLFVGGDADVTLNIGRRHSGFDGVLDARNATTAVVVTAYNPRSVVLSEAENAARHARLTELLESRGLDYALGEGRDPTGHWQAELECVVFGISLETGLEIARAFDQNAIVWIARGRAPELVYPELD
jgi:hypothetical protein